MAYLIIGGSGTVGSQVVARLAQESTAVRVLTRSSSQSSSQQNIRYVRGDLNSPQTLEPVFKDVSRVCLITPLSPNEAKLGSTVVQMAKQAGVERIVFMSIHRVDEAPHIPHFQSKIQIRHTIKESGIPLVEIMPNNFFQNDLWYQETLLGQGVYPQPIGSIGCNRVDVEDIADAITLALLAEDQPEDQYPLVGSTTWSGPEIAKTYSRFLERPVSYAGDNLDIWANAMRDTLPDWLIEDLKTMYAYFQERGLVADKADLEKQEEILRHRPRRFEAFVSQLSTKWKD